MTLERKIKYQHIIEDMMVVNNGLSLYSLLPCHITGLLGAMLKNDMSNIDSMVSNYAINYAKYDYDEFNKMLKGYENLRAKFDRVLK